MTDKKKLRDADLVRELAALLDEAGTAPAAAAPDCYMVVAGEAAERLGVVWAEPLRDACPGLRVLVNCGGGGFKAQLKRADKSGAAFALILGDDEVRDGRVAVKPLRSEAAQRDWRWTDLLHVLAGKESGGIESFLLQQ